MSIVGLLLNCPPWLVLPVWILNAKLRLLFVFCKKTLRLGMGAWCVSQILTCWLEVRTKLLSRVILAGTMTCCWGWNSGDLRIFRPSLWALFICWLCSTFSAILSVQIFGECLELIGSYKCANVCVCWFEWGGLVMVWCGIYEKVCG